MLNEAINFEKKCIFVAVPKTGSTSVRSQLRYRGGACLIPNPHLSIIQIRDSLYTYFLINSLGQNSTFPSREVPADAEIRIHAKQVFESFFKFAAVRNPWARAVSLYSRREGVRLSDRMSFQDFCVDHYYASDTCRHPTLHRNQLDWLIDENGASLMDYTYKLEEFATAIKDIARMTDQRIRLSASPENVNPMSLSSAYRDLYTPEARGLIARRFERDIEYFGYCF